MTEKNKHKNADMTRALMRGEAVQCRCIYKSDEVPLALRNWCDTTLSADMRTIYVESIPGEYKLYEISLISSPHWEFRIKPPSQETPAQIKHKNADVICALVHGEVVQAKYVGSVINVPYISWNDAQIACNEICVFNPIYSVLCIDFSALVNDDWEFRLKHPHQELIDKIEAEPSLEQYLEMDASTIVFPNISPWRSQSLLFLKQEPSRFIRWRINKPKNPHQALKDLHKERPNLARQIFSKVRFAWVVLGVEDKNWHKENDYRLVHQEVIAESKGENDE